MKPTFQGPVFENVTMTFEKFNAVLYEIGDKLTWEDVAAWIDGDWNNAEDHQAWLDKASAKEIADWVLSTYTAEEE